ncbi:PIR protein [Plasmodium ovale]|uniref:PIR Superfamily Protein n=2 Tax=Plasmodium ovale TaxID=36330 RepID=A0A1A8WPG0_PLAOA|nr:PIR Superfamily Protein [Plasmodium ovale curtisi]SBT01434.1 PIR Superfamily Protein [Plasmodium ovale curtisi]SBT84297.1 PIR protein [Plasmodium ovale]
MPSRGDSECILEEKDLPALEFNRKWKENTKFIEFENAVNLKEKINNMQTWINKFDGQLVQIYDGKSMDISRDMQDKRCRDLNYYINYILHYIPKITKNSQDVKGIIHRFKTFVDAKFKSWINFECERTEKDYTYNMDLIKYLDDYCENKNFFKKKILTEYDKKTCCKYANHVNERKRFFHELISGNYINTENRDFHIEDNCTLKNVGKTFPNVICNESIMSEIETDELPASYGYGHSHDFHQHALPGTYQEDSFNTSPTKIALTSVSTLLGACLSGLYLYRHSFVGSMLRNFQNRNNISHEDTYDDVNGMFSEDHSQYQYNTEDSNRFYLAYDPVNK